MNKPKITKINFTQKRDYQKLSILNIKDIPIEKNLIKDEQVIFIGPKGFGGNHKHPRTEWFIGYGDLSFIWLDENEKKQELSMSDNYGLILFEVPPLLPHVVINNSDSKTAVLFEYSDAKQFDVVAVNIID